MDRKGILYICEKVINFEQWLVGLYDNNDKQCLNIMILYQPTCMEGGKVYLQSVTKTFNLWDMTV